LLKQSWENGMRNSALHPPLSRLATTSHTASQLSSLFESLYQYESCLTSTGLTLNLYAVRRAWSETFSTCIQSEDDSASRRVRNPTMRPGSESKARTAT